MMADDVENGDEQNGDEEDIKNVEDIDMNMNVIIEALGEVAGKKAERINKETNQLVNGFGGSGGRYRREQKTVNRLIAEIYSPPRVTEAAKLLPGLGCIPGFALDLTTVDENGAPWDFDKPEQRKKAWDLLKEKSPMLLIGTPMCTAFSAWQRINEKIRDENLVTGVDEGNGTFEVLLSNVQVSGCKW